MPIDPMEVAGVKRKRNVDPDFPDLSIPSAKRNQYTPDNDMKNRVIRFLIHAHIRLGAMAGLRDYGDIMSWCKVTSQVYAMHNVLRQESSGGEGQLKNKVTDWSLVLKEL